MSPSNDNPGGAKLNRRTLLLGAVLLVGGAAALTRFTRGDRAVGAAVLTPTQFSLLELVCDVLIPATDTPGALAADVPSFVRGMLDEWASSATRAEIVGVLDAIGRTAWERRGAGFNEFTPEQRFELLREFDAKAMGAGDEPYARFKYLVLAGYYQSQIGATQELRYEMVPGTWRACLPLSEIGRASAV